MGRSIKEKIEDLKKYKNSLNYCRNCKYKYMNSCNNQDAIELVIYVYEDINLYADCGIVRQRLRSKLLEENCPFYETKKENGDENLG
jgi:hypothetical protein